MADSVASPCTSWPDLSLPSWIQTVFFGVCGFDQTVWDLHFRASPGGSTGAGIFLLRRQERATKSRQVRLAMR